ncbi:MAG: DNA-binding protein [wastewater metagenome]|nr:DNA-binding protein [Candidatus Loosdrechtia aerotolerans]
MKIINPSEGGLMDMKQAAEYLNVKTSTLYSMCMRREIPYVKIGRLNRFRKIDLDTWITERIQEANTNNG